MLAPLTPPSATKDKFSKSNIKKTAMSSTALNRTPYMHKDMYYLHYYWFY